MLALRNSSHSRVVAFIVVLAMILMHTFAFGGAVFAGNDTTTIKVKGISDSNLELITGIDATIDTTIALARNTNQNAEDKYEGVFPYDYHDTSKAFVVLTIYWSSGMTTTYQYALESAAGSGTINIWLSNLTPPVVPLGHDIAVTKVVDDTTATLNQTLTFVITATNMGPDAAANVVIEDALPAELVFVSANASVGSYNASTGAWTVGTLAKDASATLTIIAVFAEGAEVDDVISNTAEYDYTDNDTSNNSDTARVTVVTPPLEGHDIAVTKLVDDTTATLSQTLTFTIMATNSGPDAADNVVIDDVLPAELVFESADESVGTYVASTGAWTVGTLEKDASATLTISAVFAEGVEVGDVVSNTAIYDHVDNDITNNSSTVRVTLEESPSEGFDIAVEKSVNDNTATVGQTITFTVTVQNNGPEAANNVTIYDPVNLAGLSNIVVNTPSQGEITEGGIWLVGTLEVDGTATMTVTATIAAGTAVGAVITNTATVQYEDEFEDLDSDNDSASASVTVIASGGGGGDDDEDEEDIPDPAPPLSPAPPAPEPELVPIPEPAVPLADVPQTGINDNAILYAGLLLGSLAGITALARRRKSVSE